MEPRRFADLSRVLSSRFSRRTTLRSALLGMAGIAGLTAGTGRRAGAQDGTATPARLADDASFLFVQVASGGTFGPNPGAGMATPGGPATTGGGADYLLTLTGHTGNTVYFSDRPERIFGEAPTDQFLDGLGFSPSNPPNAALMTKDESGNEDILVVELLNPAHDAAAGTVTYGVNLLSDYEGGLGFVASRQRDVDLAPTFGSASLFIDDCQDLTQCNQVAPGMFSVPVGPLPGGAVKQCWQAAENQCGPCNGLTYEFYESLCDRTYPTCVGSCLPG